MIVNKKAKTALENDIVPIICISEKSQLSESIKDLEDKNYIIAFEPDFAIGTGKVAGIADIEEFILFIKNNVGNNVRIIYGGSVKLDNITDFLNIKNLSGVLIGGSSLEINNLLKLVERIENNL